MVCMLRSGRGSDLSEGLTEADLLVGGCVSVQPPCPALQNTLSGLCCHLLATKG